MRRGPTRVDELVGILLPRAPLPRHLSPKDLLDDAVEPPKSVASKVMALRELVKCGGRSAALLGAPVRSSADVAAHYVPLLSGDPMESFHLDARNAVRVMRCVCRGGARSCGVTPSDVLRVVVLNACSSLVVVHNHPSGDPTPSREDYDLTQQLATAANVLGVRLADHIVIGASKHLSFLDAGFLPTP